MKDTSPEMEQRFRQMILARSGEERLKMGCSMHEMAQELVRASLEERTSNLEPRDLRRALFLRFYGQEFAPESGRKILAHLGLERK